MPSQIQDKIGFETGISRHMCGWHDGTQSNYLFGDDLPKRLKDAKEASNVGLFINKSHSCSNNYRFQKRHDKRYGEQTNYSGSSSSKPDFQRGKPYHKWKKPRKQQPPPRKK